MMTTILCKIAIRSHTIVIRLKRYRYTFRADMGAFFVSFNSSNYRIPYTIIGTNTNDSYVLMDIMRSFLISGLVVNCVWTVF